MSIEPGDGYRLLKVGERIDVFDEFEMSGSPQWIRVAASHAGKPVTKEHVSIRRKLPAPTGIEAIVCSDIAERQRLGVAKYGTTVKDNPLSLKEWLQHAYEECLDQAVYLRRAIDEA